MKQILEYGTEILFPFRKPECSFMGIRSFSSTSETVLVKCTIDIDHVFPKDADELKYGLSKKTFKVTIIPVKEEDRIIYGRESTYFSDIQSVILKHNPQFEIRPYPKES